MIPIKLPLLILLLSLPRYAESDGTKDARYKSVSSVLGSEIGKTSTDLQTKINQENRTIKILKRQREAAIKKSLNAAKSERQGLNVFKKYMTLIEVRYIDHEGEYAPRQLIHEQDVKNINKLFLAYIKKNALDSTVSAQVAIETLEVGIESLEKMIETHSDPDESNNLELQIIERKTEQARNRKKILLRLVEKLNLKGIKTNSLGGKATASKKKQSKTSKTSKQSKQSKQDKTATQKKKKATKKKSIAH